eukprot:gene3232-3445_t
MNQHLGRELVFQCKVEIAGESFDATATIRFKQALSLKNKDVTSFLLEYDEVSFDVLQSNFQLKIVTESYAIVVISKSSFIDGFQLIFDSSSFNLLQSHLSLPPIYNAIPTTSFYNSTQNQQVNQSKGADNNSILLNEVYSRQDLAFQRYDTLTPIERATCKIFTFESFQTGKRRFTLLDINTFHQLYSEISIDHRHVYEIIRDSFPCRIYFDLEYSILTNPTVNGTKLTEKFIYLVLWKVYQLFHFYLDWSNVLVLDSTTDKKFSKHVIIHMTIERNENANNQEEQLEYLLPNNLYISELLQQILDDITEEVENKEKQSESGTVKHFNSPTSVIIPCELEEESNERHPCVDPLILQDSMKPTSESKKKVRQPKPEYEEFWLLNEDGQNHFFVDLGVYSRNRAFRLFGSSKFGKKKAFTLLSSDKKHYNFKHSSSTTNTSSLSLPSIHQMKRDLINDSFIIPYDLLLSEPLRGWKRKKEDEDDDNCKESYEKFETFLPYLNTRKYQILQFPSSALHGDDYNSSLHSYQRLNGQIASGSYPMTGFYSSSWKSKAILKSNHPREPSIFPTLDQYITRTIARKGGIEGILTEWMIFVKSNGDFPITKIRYQVNKNRYCENVGRMHKSNGIYYEVNLMTKELTQHCWDPDCKGFQSLPLRIPDIILPEEPNDIEARIQKKCKNI